MCKEMFGHIWKCKIWHNNSNQSFMWLKSRNLCLIIYTINRNPRLQNGWTTDYVTAPPSSVAPFPFILLLPPPSHYHSASLAILQEWRQSVLNTRPLNSSNRLGEFSVNISKCMALALGKLRSSLVLTKKNFKPVTSPSKAYRTVNILLTSPYDKKMETVNFTTRTRDSRRREFGDFYVPDDGGALSQKQKLSSVSFIEFQSCCRFHRHL